MGSGGAINHDRYYSGEKGIHGEDLDHVERSVETYLVRSDTLGDIRAGPYEGAYLMTCRYLLSQPGEWAPAFFLLPPAGPARSLTSTSKGWITYDFRSVMKPAPR